MIDEKAVLAKLHAQRAQLANDAMGTTFFGNEHATAYFIGMAQGRYHGLLLAEKLLLDLLKDDQKDEGEV